MICYFASGIMKNTRIRRGVIFGLTDCVWHLFCVRVMDVVSEYCIPNTHLIDCRTKEEYGRGYMCDLNDIGHELLRKIFIYDIVYRLSVNVMRAYSFKSKSHIVCKSGFDCCGIILLHSVDWIADI